ncbi:ECF transporter S component [Haloimpatiens massiliensis]|uniref:ECF transporter S component n=1 Tax=Haloimpatiens massiliensis TaxID=1658110 RepID=UPI000C850124|nr:ECF transporter S component [Haloimpatiens massiliensis]
MSEKTVEKRKFSTKQITVTGMLSAISVVLGITGLGYIPIPPFHTTIMHIPVIIGSLLEGPVVGGILGLIFGLTSIFQAIKTPGPVSFIFINPLVSVLPRILIGITPYYMYKLLKNIKFNKLKEKVYSNDGTTKWGKFTRYLVDYIQLILSITVGSFTNTIGVLGMIYVLYLNEYITALGVSKSAANKTFLLLVLNGFVSASMAILVSLPIIRTVKAVYYKNKKL